MYQIIADTDDFLVVDKHAGVPVHGPSNVPSLIEQLRLDLVNPALNLAHRLDTGTSGLILVAKSSEANQLLSPLFAQRLVTKRYLALSLGKPSKKQGWVVGDMLKVRDGNWMLKHTCDNPARTYFVSSALQPGLRLFVVGPQTGKTHQIRVALRSQQAPILGDTRYSSHTADRLYLHAWRLSFGFANTTYTFESWPQSGEFFHHQQLQPLALNLLDKMPAGV